MNSYDPKTRFQQKAVETGRHKELMHQPEFVASLDAALIVYCNSVTRGATPDLPSQAAAFNKMAGAREFVEAFLNLGEKFDLPKRTIEQNLKHT